jgi:hypothetical protein
MQRIFGGTGDVPKTAESHPAMNVGEILIWESSNLLLRIPVVICLAWCWCAGFREGRCSRSVIGSCSIERARMRGIEV